MAVIHHCFAMNILHQKQNAKVTCEYITDCYFLHFEGKKRFDPMLADEEKKLKPINLRSEP